MRLGRRICLPHGKHYLNANSNQIRYYFTIYRLVKTKQKQKPTNQQIIPQLSNVAIGGASVTITLFNSFLNILPLSYWHCISSTNNSLHSSRLICAVCYTTCSCGFLIHLHLPKLGLMISPAYSFYLCSLCISVKNNSVFLLTQAKAWLSIFFFFLFLFF